MERKSDEIWASRAKLRILVDSGLREVSKIVSNFVDLSVLLKINL